MTEIEGTSTDNERTVITTTTDEEGTVFVYTTTSSTGAYDFSVPPDKPDPVAILTNKNWYYEKSHFGTGSSIVPSAFADGFYTLRKALRATSQIQYINESTPLYNRNPFNRNLYKI